MTRLLLLIAAPIALLLALYAWAAYDTSRLFEDWEDSYS